MSFPGRGDGGDHRGMPSPNRGDRPETGKDENGAPRTLLHAPGDAYTLINELAEPVPRTLRGKYFEKVCALLSGDDILAPAKIVEAWQRFRSS